jgi:hypothetical protein
VGRLIERRHHPADLIQYAVVKGVEVAAESRRIQLQSMTVAAVQDILALESEGGSIASSHEVFDIRSWESIMPFPLKDKLSYVALSGVVPDHQGLGQLVETH